MTLLTQAVSSDQLFSICTLESVSFSLIGWQLWPSASSLLCRPLPPTFLPVVSLLFSSFIFLTHFCPSSISTTQFSCFSSLLCSCIPTIKFNNWHKVYKLKKKLPTTCYLIARWLTFMTGVQRVNSAALCCCTVETCRICCQWDIFVMAYLAYIKQCMSLLLRIIFSNSLKWDKLNYV